MIDALSAVTAMPPVNNFFVCVDVARGCSALSASRPADLVDLGLAANTKQAKGSVVVSQTVDVSSLGPLRRQ